MDAEALVNRRLGSYLIQEVLGQGGMGVVYRAVDETSGYEVAVKTICPATPLAQSAIDCFRREAACLARCHDPHIATVYQAGRAEGVDFIAMELMASTLQAKIGSHGASPSEVVGTGAQILIGLAAAHRAGVVHRDVKPANIGISHSGMVKLLDFGVASTLPWISSRDESSTGASPFGVVGSLPYMPPEQLRGDAVDPRADLYSTGAVLYELASGRPPFQEGNAVRLMDAILHRRPRPLSGINPDISVVLERVILRALAKNPSSRYPSAAAMMDALLRHGDGETAVYSQVMAFLETRASVVVSSG